MNNFSKGTENAMYLKVAELKGVNIASVKEMHDKVYPYIGALACGYLDVMPRVEPEIKHYIDPYTGHFLYSVQGLVKSKEYTEERLKGIDEFLANAPVELLCKTMQEFEGKYGDRDLIIKTEDGGEKRNIEFDIAYREFINSIGHSLLLDKTVQQLMEEAEAKHKEHLEDYNIRLSWAENDVRKELEYTAQDSEKVESLFVGASVAKNILEKGGVKYAYDVFLPNLYRNLTTHGEKLVFVMMIRNLIDYYIANFDLEKYYIEIIKNFFKNDREYFNKVDKQDPATGKVERM
ncbi:hypothetical protein D3C81_10700 [compost metagenome]